MPRRGALLVVDCRVVCRHVHFDDIAETVGGSAQLGRLGLLGISRGESFVLEAYRGVP